MRGKKRENGCCQPIGIALVERVLAAVPFFPKSLPQFKKRPAPTGRFALWCTHRLRQGRLPIVVASRDDHFVTATERYSATLVALDLVNHLGEAAIGAF
jgi:hypothetical protein